jgi:hypothetical protein
MKEDGFKWRFGTVETKAGTYGVNKLQYRLIRI